MSKRFLVVVHSGTVYTVTFSLIVKKNAQSMYYNEFGLSDSLGKVAQSFPKMQLTPMEERIKMAHKIQKNNSIYGYGGNINYSTKEPWEPTTFTFSGYF